MFVETLIISSSFFAIAVILVASVLFRKEKADRGVSHRGYALWKVTSSGRAMRR
jgi:hypothetical protein